MTLPDSFIVKPPSVVSLIGGDVGVYGHPSDYSLDPVCYIVGKKDLPVATPYAVSEEACEG